MRAPRGHAGERRPARHPLARHAARPRLCRQADDRRRRSARDGRRRAATAAAALVVDARQCDGPDRRRLRHGAAIERGADDAHRGRRGARQQSLRRDGLLGGDGAAARHDRHRHHQRAADDGAVGRHRQDRRHQSAWPSPFPAATKPPIVLDIAFGATAHGKIRVYHQKGHADPGGLGVRRGRQADDRCRRRR